MAASRTLPKTGCIWAEEAARAWRHIDSMTEPSFDTIITTSAQMIDFTQRTHDCESDAYSSYLTSGELDETMLKIYAKIIDLLHAAAVTYTNIRPLSAGPGTIGKKDTTHANGKTALCLQHRPPLEDDVQAELPDTPSNEVVCVPSKTMALGEYELDSRQSMSLGLLLISQMANNFIIVLQKMAGGPKRSGGVASSGRVDARILKLLSRLASLRSKVATPSP